MCRGCRRCTGTVLPTGRNVKKKMEEGIVFSVCETARHIREDGMRYTKRVTRYDLY